MKWFRRLFCGCLLILLLGMGLVCKAEEVQEYEVFLPEGIAGAETAVQGQDYWFMITDNDQSYYGYELSVMVGGNPATAVSKGKGTYMISGVSGPISVEVIRVPKTYSVSVTGDGASLVSYSSPAFYGEDYRFLADPRFVDVTITVGGQEYPYELIIEDEHAILGSYVTGNISIKATKIQRMVEVSFAGSGAMDVTGASQVEEGMYYRFTVRKTKGYAYTISAYMGGTKMELIPDGDSAWMVGPAAEPIEIVVEKTEQAEAAEEPKAPATGRPTGSSAAVTVIPSEQKPQVLPFEEVPLPEADDETVLEEEPVQETVAEMPKIPELPDVDIGQLPEKTVKESSFPWWIAALCGGCAMLLTLVILLATRKNVVFETGTKAEIRTQRIHRGRFVSRPPEPRKYGAVFAGWFADAELTRRWIFEEHKVEDNMTLYAKWV